MKSQTYKPRSFLGIEHMKTIRFTHDQARDRMRSLSALLMLDRAVGEEGYWRTIRGAKVHLNGHGIIDKGPAHLVGKHHDNAHGETRPGFTRTSRTEKGTHTHVESETAARVHAMKLPPGWSGVQVSHDPSSPLQAVGYDEKGRTQYRYSSQHSDTASAAKFARVKAFVAKLPEIRKQIADHPSEEAAVLRLVDQTGLRIGSEADTGAEKQAYGASTLTAGHVRDSGGKVSLDFTGKKGVHIRQEISHPGIAAELSERAKRGGKLYNTSDSKVRDFLHGIAPGFKVKDFRTAVAADTAIAATTEHNPSTVPELLAAKNAVGEKVAKKLGNTAAVALKSYIPPEVFTAWHSKVSNREQAALIEKHAAENGMGHEMAGRDWIGKHAKAYREDFNERLKTGKAGKYGPGASKRSASGQSKPSRSDGNAQLQRRADQATGISDVGDGLRPGRRGRFAGRIRGGHENAKASEVALAAARICRGAIMLDRTQYDESKHPRATDGRFGHTAGQHQAKNETSKSSPQIRPEVREAARRIASRIVGGGQKIEAAHRDKLVRILGEDSPEARDVSGVQKDQYVGKHTRETALDRWRSAKSMGVNAAKPKHGSEMGYRDDSQQKQFETFLDTEYEAKHGKIYEDDLADAQPAATPGKLTSHERGSIEADTSKSKIKGFQTAQGSTYAIDDQGRTTRNKTLHVGHDRADVGLKDASAATYYVHPDHAAELGMAGQSNSSKKRVIVENGHAYAVSWNEKQGKFGTDTKPVPLSKEPKIGSSPLELWKGDADASIAKDGRKVYGSWHSGNPITKIDYHDASPHDPTKDDEGGLRRQTVAGIESRLHDFHQQTGSHDAESTTDSGEYEQVSADRNRTFHKELPGEVKTFLEGRYNLRKHFKITDDVKQAGGADAMGELGEDKYFDAIERMGKGRTAQAVEHAKKSGDPEMQFLATAHDRRGKGANMLAMPGDKLEPGHSFTLHGEQFTVEEDADGNRVMSGPSHYPELDPRMMQHVPIDKGSLRRRKEIDPMKTKGDDFVPFSREWARNRLIELSQGNLFGESSGVGGQGKMFDKGIWRTIRRAHVFIENGKVTKGPAHLIGKHEHEVDAAHKAFHESVKRRIDHDDIKKAAERIREKAATQDAGMKGYHDAADRSWLSAKARHKEQEHLQPKIEQAAIGLAEVHPDADLKSKSFHSAIARFYVSGGSNPVDAYNHLRRSHWWKNQANRPAAMAIFESLRRSDQTLSAADALYLSAAIDDAPALTLGAGLPSTLNDQPIHYRWIRSAIAGNWSHPRTGASVNIDEKRMKHWVDGIKLFRARGVDVPACKDHRETAENSLGAIYDARTDGQNIDTLVGFYGDEALKTAQRNKVSLCIAPAMRDSHGNRYSDVIRHIGITPVPVIHGLSGFVAAS